MTKKTTHVVPNKEEGGWDIKQGRGERSSGHFDRKDDAIDRAGRFPRIVIRSYISTEGMEKLVKKIVMEMIRIRRGDDLDVWNR